jgi:hypothetical protein
MFAGVLFVLISWLCCSLGIAKKCRLSSALLYELLYRFVEPQKTLGEWYSMSVFSIISSSYPLVVSPE